MRLLKLPSIAVAAAFLLFPSIGQSAEVRLLASGAVKDAYLELLPTFEKTSGHKVIAAWSSTTDIQKRVAGGEVADLVILGDSGTEALISAGKLVAGTRASFARSGIYVAVRADAPAPDISTADALKRTVLAAKSVAYSEGASGTYLVGMFQRLGIYDQVKSKASVAKANEPVGEKVTRDEAEIGFHQLSELIPVKGIRIVGPLPAGLQHITVFSGAVHSRATNPDTARALIQFLTTRDLEQSLKKHGLDPG
jgi:molybdate transport system substrate-binding protein